MKSQTIKSPIKTLQKQQNLPKGTPENPEK